MQPLGAQPFRFRLLAAGGAATALYHLAALLIPPFGHIAYSPTYPPLRHVVFIAINLCFAYLVLKRPRWLIWPLLVLATQVLNGHGVRLWCTWTAEHRVQWIDFIVITGVLYAVISIWQDRRRPHPP